MRTLFVLALFALLAPTAFAQPPERPNEVSLGIGDCGYMFLLFDALETIAGSTYGNQLGGFQLYASYERRMGTWNGVGVMGSWAFSSKYKYDGDTGEKLGKDDRYQLALTADWRAHWLRRPQVGLYSGLSAGMLYFTDKYRHIGYWPFEESPPHSMTTLAFRIVPIGLRVGGDWGGFLEPGFGTHGFVRAGLARRF